MADSGGNSTKVTPVKALALSPSQNLRIICNEIFSGALLNLDAVVLRSLGHELLQ